MASFPDREGHALTEGAYDTSRGMYQTSAPRQWHASLCSDPHLLIIIAGIKIRVARSTLSSYVKSP
jgi:hypothetical protein